MKTLEKRFYTVEDYEKLPEGSPYQLIEGELVMSPAPAPEHQRASLKLTVRLFHLIEEQKRGKVFYAPVDVYLEEGNVFQPDIVVLLEGSRAKITSRGIEGAPDLVVEILSPSSAYYDLVEKKEVYERTGVKEYWVVDPKRKSVEVFKNTQEGFVLLSRAKGEGRIRSELLGTDIELSEVFEELKP